MRAGTLRRPAPHRPALPGAGRGAWALAIVATPALLAVHALDLAAALAEGSAWAALGGAVLGILAADLGSGLVHWACDTWGDERTPLVGPLIRNFREHHRDPEAILAHDWVEVNRETVAAAGALLALLSLPPAQRWLAAHPAVWAGLFTFVAWSAAANQVHRLAHTPRPPAGVRLAARLGLVLGGAHHARHHRPPYAGAYCIATGWLNPVLDRTGFWRGLERAVGSATGARPRAGATRSP